MAPLKNLKKFNLVYGDMKKQDMASIVPKASILPKDFMASKTSYGQR